MNKILRDLINTGEVASFMDDILVGTEEEYNKIVKKVSRKLAKNHLCIKPEKCKWKVREVEFIEVVIELDEIKMEEEKVKGILEQLTLKEVKDI